MAVHIENYAGPPPEIEFTVFPTRHAIPCHFVFVCDGDGNLPSGVTNMQTFAESWISAVNEIYRQVDMEFLLLPSCSVITNADSFNISTEAEPNSVTYDNLFRSFQSMNGIRVYVVNSMYFEVGTPELQAVTISIDDDSRVSLGIVIPSYMAAFSLAHEIGHACGLEDIYWDVSGLSGETETPLVPLAHLVYSSDIPDDWTGFCGYYSPHMRFSDMVPRLLMHGYPDEDDFGTDIPSGSVYGIGGNGSGGWTIEFRDIGLNSLNKTPYTIGAGEIP